MIEKILEYITKRCIYIRMKLQTCVGYSQAEKNVRLEELYTIKQECERMRKYHNKCCEEFEKEKKEWLEKYNQVSRDFYNGKYCDKENCSLLKTKEQECEELKKYLNQIRDEELSHLDIEWDEYETSARQEDYSNIITLVERALGEIDD